MKFDNCICGTRKTAVSEFCRGCRTEENRRTGVYFLTPEDRKIKGRAATAKWQRANREHRKTYQKEYRKTEEGISKYREADRRRYTKERGRFSRFKYHLRTEYKITFETYCLVFLVQNGACAICARPFGSLLPWDSDGSVHACVDHDHTTESFRGLLCKRCNTAMTLVDDDERLVKSVAYRDSHRANR
jgi:hypothetical protein